jgi:hypothetical protein
MGFQQCGLPGCKSFEDLQNQRAPQADGLPTMALQFAFRFVTVTLVVKWLPRFASAGIVRPRLSYNGEYYPEVVLVTTSAGQYFSSSIFMMY